MTSNEPARTLHPGGLTESGREALTRRVIGNGKAFPGGVDGRTFRGIGGSLLTIEPTNPGDRLVHLWSWTDGEERAGMTLPPREVLALLADLARRAQVLDPATGSAPPAAAPAAAGPVPLPDPPLPRIADALVDMRAAADTRAATRAGDPATVRIRGWVAEVEPEARWAAVVIAAAVKVAAAAEDRAALPVGPRMSAALRDLDAALARRPAPLDDVVDAVIHDADCPGGAGICCSAR